jgi:hypothetical protein
MYFHEGGLDYAWLPDAGVVNGHVGNEIFSEARFFLNQSCHS